METKVEKGGLREVERDRYGAMASESRDGAAHLRNSPDVSSWTQNKSMHMNRPTITCFLVIIFNYNRTHLIRVRISVGFSIPAPQLTVMGLAMHGLSFMRTAEMKKYLLHPHLCILTGLTPRHSSDHRSRDQTLEIERNLLVYYG